jgi:hypothetical protein
VFKGCFLAHDTIGTGIFRRWKLKKGNEVTQSVPLREILGLPYPFLSVFFPSFHEVNRPLLPCALDMMF